MQQTRKEGPLIAFRPTGLGRAVVAAMGPPALVTLLALLDRRPPTAIAAVLYVLAVAAASGIAGAAAGLTASILSFLALNFFFTPPLHTFVADKAQDLVALVVFLLVSIITGLLLSAAVREKARAERREAQTRLLNQLSSGLLSGQSLEDVLGKFATNLLRLLDLARCEIEIVMSRLLEIDRSASNARGEPYELALTNRGEHVGALRVTPPAIRKRLDGEEREVVESVAGQLSLALESLRLSDEVQRAQFEAETARLRAALFSGVTHDLKTPLSAITASVTSLQDGSRFTPEEQHEHLDTIRQEAEHLDRLITNLMDLARLRAGALVPSKVPAAIDELIEAVVARLRPVLAGRDVQVHLRGELPEMPMDVVQMDQLLTNLIENAAKFSPARAPIQVSAVGNADQIRVTVTDKGPGIPPAERTRIFQPFERATEDVAGTGLGLAIAQAVVGAHGGRIWAQDAPGGGAAVTFELPVNGELRNG